MTDAALSERLKQIVIQHLPLPGRGRTPDRHQALVEIGREDLTLAKLAEAHWDAVAILAEAGLSPHPGALYAVWASEVPGQAMLMEHAGTGLIVSGSKPFCSGVDLVDRALITANSPEAGSPASLAEVDLRRHRDCFTYDLTLWKTGAFAQTHTGSLTFHAMPVAALIGEPGWYLDRPGFWHGACGPAACWAGGIAGLLDFALASRRGDPHTLAHLGALQANVWGMLALLQCAGREMDSHPDDTRAALEGALTLRHLTEALGTDSLRRFARAYGPQPLSMNADISRRYAEADLYLRQFHGERDLETLGRLVTQNPPRT